MHHRGETIEEELPSDLALTQERCKHARDAHPVVTARSRMKRELLTRLVLAAATAADGEDPDAEELAEERQAAAAAAELAWEAATDGWRRSSGSCWNEYCRACR